MTFVCVLGEGLPTGGNNEVSWQFTNNTGLTRRLVRVDVTWPQPPGRLLQSLQFGGTTIWNLGANFSPVTINSNFVGSPTSRNINDTASKYAAGHLQLPGDRRAGVHGQGVLG